MDGPMAASNHATTPEKKCLSTEPPSHKRATECTHVEVGRGDFGVASRHRGAVVND